jgi:hypothetical protein
MCVEGRGPFDGVSVSGMHRDELPRIGLPRSKDPCSPCISNIMDLRHRAATLGPAYWVNFVK